MASAIENLMISKRLIDDAIRIIKHDFGSRFPKDP